MARYSQQRELILNAVRQNPVHPSADDIYHIVKQQNSNISLGTVYRNLNYLSDNGFIKKIQIPNAPDRFDGRTEPHCHMICQKCGKVYDLSCHIEDLKDEICQETSHCCLEIHILATGICKNCSH